MTPLVPDSLPRLVWRKLASIFAAAAIAMGPAITLAADRPTVVTIESRAEASTAAKAIRTGLGFVVEEQGFLLTTWRNVTHPESGLLLPDIRATIAGNAGSPPYQARIIGVEPTLDLAVLKLETEDRFMASDLLSSRRLAIGQEIFAPTANGAGVTMGRVVGLNSKECYQESMTSTMYRGEIELSPGLAGAPIFIQTGEVVAIYTGYTPPVREDHLDDSDEVHLLPIFLAQNIYESLKQKQSLRSPWTGFSVRALSAEEAGAFPTPHGHRGGIAIEAVIPGSPAEEMGVREGDVLLQLGHNPILSVADFQKWLYLYGVGHRVKLVLLREGAETLVTDYVIEERPAWAKPR